MNGNQAAVQDPVLAMLAQSALKNTQFAPTSRYFGIDTAALALGGGVGVAYLKRRFLPDAGRFQLVQEHRVAQGERLDTIAAHYFGDPELFWRLCDANDALRPQALTEAVGRTLRITLPLDVAGTSLP